MNDELMYAWQNMPEDYRNMLLQAASRSQVSLEQTLRMFLIENSNSGEGTPHRNEGYPATEAMYSGIMGAPRHGGVNTGLMGPTGDVRQNLWNDELLDAWEDEYKTSPNRFHPFNLILN